MMRRTAVLAVALLLGVVASGCGTVKPWQRDLLARQQMQVVPSPMLHAVDQHVYFSKEGSAGGQDVGGGGCGCN